ncbi:hypothetical protein JKP88DRAFT_157545 [Tribonema minus]|uniref:PROP1-like PPR domain-containing protein n=1 Tax=Tribonema minus TaxID=303371 RepID=A0A835YW87_9STRA|nr:hypothetical protein JKP88DRAFT_157545 [Tribonema minus]
MAWNGAPDQALAALHRLCSLGASIAFDYKYALQAYETPPHNWYGALKVLNEMESKGFQWTSRACSHALHACAFAGRLNHALELIANMYERGLSPYPADYLRLISDRGGSKQAIELSQSMEQLGVMPNFKHYSSAINVCGTAGDWASAVHIFQQMQHKGMRAHTHCWNALLDALGRAKQIDLMLIAYRNMLTSGQRPDIIALNCVLGHAGAAGECGIVDDIWREMHQLQLTPDTQSYGAFINCYAVAGEPEKAEAVLAEMGHSAAVKPDASSFNR